MTIENLKIEIDINKAQIKESSSFLEHQNTMMSHNNTMMANKLQQLTEKMTLMQENFKEELSNALETKNMNIMLKDNENRMLNDQILLLNNTINRLHAEYKSLQENSQSTLQQQLFDSTQIYNNDLADLRSQLKQQTADMNKLLEVNSKLQSDYNAILRREEIIRKESMSKHDDINDLRSKLYNISAKLATMEGEHTDEMKKLLNVKEKKLE